MDSTIFSLHYGVESPEALMECTYNYPYLNNQINYGDKVLKMWKEKKDITPYIIHEMCHPITDPLYCKASSRWTTHEDVKDEREKLTDYISHIIIKNKL